MNHFYGFKYNHEREQKRERDEYHADSEQELKAYKEDEKEKESIYDKYRNPDTRCGYPFEPCGAGYCWSYAHHVDGTEGYEDMESICPGCECFIDKRKGEWK